MRNRKDLVFALMVGVVIVIGTICLTMVVSRLNRRNTGILPLGGKNVETAFKISQDEQIEIAFRLKGDDWINGYVYWDDNEEQKQELELHFFTMEGQIDVPNALGVHKLTIKMGLLMEYNYYYEVVKGKSD